jgi:hypothetical protein
MEAEAELLAEEREFMFIDMTNMTPKQRSWVEKRVPSSNNVRRDRT